MERRVRWFSGLLESHDLERHVESPAVYIDDTGSCHLGKKVGWTDDGEGCARNGIEEASPPFWTEMGQWTVQNGHQRIDAGNEIMML